jgi:3-(3-hydroxy-phenyl)propionate hydroxylase
MTKKTQIVIAGAGPVGTIAAYYLAQQGLDVVVLEAAATCMEDMRASTFHPPTLELLDQLDITDRLVDQGLKAPIYQYRIRNSEEVLSFDLSELADTTKYAYRLQCEQYKLARLLVQKLEDSPNAQVLFQHRLVHFEQDAAGVKIAVETPHKMEHFEADYLIAADGANSIVRKWLGVKFDGFTYPEKFLTLSTDLLFEDYYKELAHVNYVSDPEEWVVLLRAPTAWRVLVPVDDKLSDDVILSDEHKSKIFKGLVGHGDDVDTNHRTIYRVHQRVANQYNHGRVFLVGDAAHLNNPLGGLGMNSGIQDAFNLCEKLTSIMQEGGDADALMPLFDRQRRTVMHNFIQAQTINNKRMMEHASDEYHRAEWQRMEKINQDDDLRREFLLRQSMIQSMEDAAAIT